MQASEFIEVFMEELEEQLIQIEQGIIALEHDKDPEAAVQSLFRAAHTLKGSSAAMGLVEMKNLTHEMEMILELVRSGKQAVSGELIDLLLSCLDLLVVLKNQFASGEGRFATSADLVVRLKHFAGTDASKHSAQTFTYTVRVVISPDCPMKTARAFLIKHCIAELGEIAGTDPDLDSLPDDGEPEHFSCIVTTSFQEDELKAKIAATVTDVSSIDIFPYRQEAPELADEETVLELQDKEKRKSKTVRVDVERLEQLMNLVGELVIDQTQVARIGGILNAKYASDETVDELDKVSDHISRIIGELQDSVMKARMLPLEQLFMRFPRMVRDLSQQLGKEVELEIAGAETELDRTVLEVIGDPLIHLIRNALDHGIETPDIRLAGGKPAKGLLQITAAHKENQVIITVRNDGAPIEPDNMKAAAVRKGIITEDEALALTDREATNLIFRPGFSTAASVSDISGRGVGMDIVKNHIEQLNGLIEVESGNDGTVFSIKLPLTLAIITGLLVGLNAKTFIIPMSNVVEIVRVNPNDIQTIKGEPIVVIRGEVMPLIWLHDCFGVNRPAGSDKYIPVVIVGTGEKRMALVVDELKGNQEVVVKSLGGFAGKRDGISGATILGDGTVGLIVEVSGIAKLIQLANGYKK
ncbi:chemotaxis protein CheA [Paenibacillus thermotolerans]|uniref:chemotaxis protein CheA n=1 Tax=Paenibacillus thermotolerans TaxID=3027807 RepID=UPI002367EB68|nr:MULTISPECIES: chemotaxis protein CheA [unclassified Paenibacillus]